MWLGTGNSSAYMVEVTITAYQMDSALLTLVLPQWCGFTDVSLHCSHIQVKLCGNFVVVFWIRCKAAGMFS